MTRGEATKVARGDAMPAPVLLDLDNTLSDRELTFQRWAREFCAARQLPAGTADWIITRDEDGYADRLVVFRAIREHCGLTDSAGELVSGYRKRALDFVVPTKGAIETLVTLRDVGHKTVILTNGGSAMQHAKMDALGLRSIVDAVVVSGDLGFGKPDPRVFHVAADAVGAPIVGAWMVGDSPANDITGAARVGMWTAWMSRGRTWKDTGVAPTIALDTLRDLVPRMQAGRT